MYVLLAHASRQSRSWLIFDVSQMEAPGVDLRIHLTRIEESLAELQTFHPRTAAPAAMPHQLIGTILDNTIVLLTAPANSIDRGSRNVVFSDSRNWLSAMQAVHRSFFSSLMSATEAGLAFVCAAHNAVVESSQRKKMMGIVEAIERSAAAANVELRELKQLRKSIPPDRPIFTDYLESVLKLSSISDSDKKVWRHFFRALSIVRNKASHSDTTLSEQERTDMRAGGCATMISPQGDLVLNPRMYAQVADFVLRFFDLVLQSLGTSGEGRDNEKPG
jgi:hypothetical protein